MIQNYHRNLRKGALANEHFFVSLCLFKITFLMYNLLDLNVGSMNLTIRLQKVLQGLLDVYKSIEINIL